MDNRFGFGPRQLIYQLGVNVPRPRPPTDVGNTLVINGNDSNAVGRLSGCTGAGKVVVPTLQGPNEVGCKVQPDGRNHNSHSGEPIGPPEGPRFSSSFRHRPTLTPICSCVHFATLADDKPRPTGRAVGRRYQMPLVSTRHFFTKRHYSLGNRSSRRFRATSKHHPSDKNKHCTDQTQAIAPHGCLWNPVTHGRVRVRHGSCDPA